MSAFRGRGGFGLGLGLGFVLVESRFWVRLWVRRAFWFIIQSIGLRVNVEIDDLVIALESGTFRDRVMIRIQCI